MTEALTCYQCGQEIPLRGETRRVKDPDTGRWHDEEVEPAPSFVSLPLHDHAGRPVVDAKGIAVSIYLCHRCGVEEA